MHRFSVIRRQWAAPLRARFPPLLPLLLLLLVLASMYLFGYRWDGFYQRGRGHDWNSTKNMALAENFSPSHNFLMFLYQYPMPPDGAPAYNVYNRFPVGSFALIKLVTLPFGDAIATKLYAARMLMLLIFAAAAAMAYLSLRRITASRSIALAATLLAFSSYFLLYYSDMISNEATMDLFGMLLVFHGMTVFIQEGRFGQLAAKTCFALLIGWHIYALLLPFIALGLGGEIIRAARDGGPYAPLISSLNLAARVRIIAAAVVGSRYFRLGLIALLFGLAMLSFNFGSEYVALDGETPLTELPSVRSMIKRFGQDPEYRALRAESVAWENFLPDQVGRIGKMMLPYVLTAHSGGLGHPHPAGPLNLPYSTLGVMAAGICLFWLLFVRRDRMLLVTLALAGLCWGFGMRYNTARHDFESVFYVGIPLVLFTLILLALRRWRPGLPAVVLMAALPVFILSAWQHGRMEALYAEPELDATRTALMADYQEISSIVQGNKVFIQISGPFNNSTLSNARVPYYLAGNILQLDEKSIFDCGPQCGQYFDYIISDDRNLLPSLLTPSNRIAFLFDADGLDTEGITAAYRSEYEAVRSGDYGEPIARSEFDVYMADGKLIYHQSQCRRQDTEDKFLLHVTPEDRNVLPEARRQYGFENLDFDFMWRGVVFDGNCLIIAPLPEYEIGRIRTGRYITRQPPIWSVEFAAASHNAKEKP